MALALDLVEVGLGYDPHKVVPKLARRLTGWHLPYDGTEERPIIGIHLDRRHSEGAIDDTGIMICLDIGEGGFVFEATRDQARIYPRFPSRRFQCWDLGDVLVLVMS